MRHPWGAVLEGERAVSWNTWYAGKHWSQRNAESHRVHAVVRAAIDPQHDQIFDVQVDIFIEASYADHPVDSDNVCGKPYIDGLIGWIIADDDSAHVQWVHLRGMPDTHNAVTIQVVAVEEIT